MEATQSRVIDLVEEKWTQMLKNYIILIGIRTENKKENNWERYCNNDSFNNLLENQNGNDLHS